MKISKFKLLLFKILDKKSEESYESITKFFDKHSNDQTPKFVDSLIQENQSLRARIIGLEKE
jgi:hypothetical protein